MENSEPPRRQREWIYLAGIATGLLMTALGATWTSLVPSTSVWTPEQAAEHTAASEALHEARRAGHAEPEEPAGGSAPALANQAEALATAKARFDRIEAALEQARTGPQRTSAWLVRIGLAAMAVFGIGYLASGRH